jgi:hypothetical protein
MVAIIHQKDKRSGITYAYESVSYWDKEKKQSRATRTLIGRVDKETGEIVPTDGRNRKAKDDTIPVKKVPKKAVKTQRSFDGGTYLLDPIGEKLDLPIPSEVVRSMKIKPGDVFRVAVTEENGTLVLRYVRVFATKP